MVYNMEEKSVDAGISLWDVLPGKWTVRQGIDLNADQQIDHDDSKQTVYVENGTELDLSLAPGAYNIIHFELEEPSQTSYAERPDLAICASGISIKNSEITARVYSQGAVGSPETILVLKDASGKRIASAVVPALEAPLDLIPRWHDVTLQVPAGAEMGQATLEVDADQEINQITRMNTIIMFEDLR